MSCLLYCVVHDNHQEPRPKLRFLGYPRASIMIRAGGLGAVVSKASSADLAPDVPRLLVYAKIVESFNRDRTVIPMRYGSRFGDLAEIAAFLEQHRERYLRLLGEVDGRVEMSAHASLGNPAAPPPAGGSSRPLIRLAREAAGPGAAYLAERRRYYALKGEFEKRRDEIRKGICEMAEGAFVRYTSECATREGKEALSMHFLVPRQGIASFTDVLRPLTTAPEVSLAITGPWPPYNFVCARASKLPN